MGAATVSYMDLSGLKLLHLLRILVLTRSKQTAADWFMLVLSLSVICRSCIYPALLVCCKHQLPLKSGVDLLSFSIQPGLQSILESVEFLPAKGEVCLQKPRIMMDASPSFVQ